MQPTRATPVPSTEVVRAGVSSWPSNQSGSTRKANPPSASDGTASTHSTAVMVSGCRPWSGASVPLPRKASSHSRIA